MKPRNGYTLFEMLLVLAVLAIIAAISWPLLDRFYAQQRLKEVAEEVRSELATARLRAIEDGVPYEFHYEPSARGFYIVPSEPLESAVESNPETVLPTSTSQANRVPQLDEGIEFRVPTPQRGSSSSIAAGSDSPWHPIIFQPDGSAVDAVLELLETSAGRSIQLSIRGLTGGVTISPIREESR